MSNHHALAAIKDRLAEVRDSLGEAHPSIPAGEIIARARRHRVRRRLIPGITAVLALAAGAAVAVTALLPASHPASRRPGVQLTAWTVVKRPGGTIKVTIRELHDPAGLQRRLRADGVPATVTFLDRQNPACRPWPAPACSEPTPPQARHRGRPGACQPAVHRQLSTLHIADPVISAACLVTGGRRISQRSW